MRKERHGSLCRDCIWRALSKFIADFELLGASVSLWLVRLSKHHNRTDGLAGMHQVEALVDVFELELVGDEVVDVDFLFHVPVHDLRHVGAAACAAEGRPLPDTASHQLEWPGR